MVELSLTHATGAAIAAPTNDTRRGGVRELRGNYIPQISTGAGLGYSYGFPLSLEGSAPSLFNITAQSALLNPSLKEFLQASKSDSAAASLKSKDERNQIIQDAAQSYAELAKWEQRLAKLQETEADAREFEAAVAKRTKEGVDSELDETKARLSAARVRLRIAEARAQLMYCANIYRSSRDFRPPAFRRILVRSRPRRLRLPEMQRKMLLRIHRSKRPSTMPARSISAPRESTAPFGPASTLPPSMPCSRGSIIFRTTTFPRSPASLRSANSCA